MKVLTSRKSQKRQIPSGSVEVIDSYFTHIIKLRIEQEEVGTYFQTTSVNLLYEKGKKLEKGNYKPVSKVK